MLIFFGYVNLDRRIGAQIFYGPDDKQIIQYTLLGMVKYSKSEHLVW